MRLINTKTLELQEFHDDRIPSYAILSHTWAEGEVTFQEMLNGLGRDKIGYQKIYQCCQQAVSENIAYAWVDTCCINKQSSAELSEAINSMYLWYKQSTVCYAYLQDLEYGQEEKLSSNHELCEIAFRGCRWFYRGWTLQELIAPTEITFFDALWRAFGTKYSLKLPIRGVTGIDLEVLEGADPRHFSIATRMSWASNRETTRVEDSAYSLLGIMDVNMPLLYGEGRKAFQRLQHEIMNQNDDYSIFAWKLSNSETFQKYCKQSGISTESELSANYWTLAQHPACFSDSGSFKPSSSLFNMDITATTFSTSNRGLLMHTSIGPSTNYRDFKIAILPVRARFASGMFNAGDFVGIYVLPLDGKGTYVRILPNTWVAVDNPSTDFFVQTVLFPRSTPELGGLTACNFREPIEGYGTPSTVISAYPRRSVDEVYFGSYKFSGWPGQLAGAFLLLVQSRLRVLVLGIDTNGAVQHFLRDLPHASNTFSAKQMRASNYWYIYILVWLSVPNNRRSLGSAGENCFELTKATTKQNAQSWQQFGVVFRNHMHGYNGAADVSAARFDFDYERPEESFTVVTDMATFKRISESMIANANDAKSILDSAGSSFNEPKSRAGGIRKMFASRGDKA